MTVIFEYYYANTWVILLCARPLGTGMPKVSLDMPLELLDDIKIHVGDGKKFISVADAIRSACRKLLDRLDEIDKAHGRR